MDELSLQYILSLPWILQRVSNSLQSQTSYSYFSTTTERSPTFECPNWTCLASYSNNRSFLFVWAVCSTLLMLTWKTYIHQLQEGLVISYLRFVGLFWSHFLLFLRYSHFIHLFFILILTTTSVFPRHKASSGSATIAEWQSTLCR